jgi:hypothetical protein
MLENFASGTLTNFEIFADVFRLFSGVSPTNFNTWVAANAGSLSPITSSVVAFDCNSSWNGTSSSNVLVTGQSLNAGVTGIVYISFDVTVTLAAPNNTLNNNSG